MSDRTDQSGAATPSIPAVTPNGSEAAEPHVETETSGADTTREADTGAPPAGDANTGDADTGDADTGDADIGDSDIGDSDIGDSGSDTAAAENPVAATGTSREGAAEGAPDTEVAAEPGADGPVGADEPAGDDGTGTGAGDAGAVGEALDGEPAGGGGTGSAPDGAGPVAAEDSGAPGRRGALLSARFWGASPAGLLIGLLLALLGFGLVIQLQSNTGSGLANRRQDDLVRILDDLSSREDRLRQQINALEETRNRLSTGGDNSQAALEEARRRAAELGILAGTLQAAGPGIQMTITDPHRRVTAEDMLDAIEELRGAGAEAIAVGPARIGLSSAFTQDTPSSPIVVEDRSLTPPYVILAIGDPSTLATAMTIPGGVVDTVRSRDGDTRIVQQERLLIMALREVRSPQYAQPSPTPSN